MTTTDLWARARSAPARRWILGLAIAHVVLQVVLFPRAVHAPLVGDEAQYVDGAKALANLLRDLGSFSSPDRAELSRSLVGSGWFMPGMSVVMSPLYLLVPGAGLGLTRLYVGIFSTILLFVAAASARRTFGDRSAIALLVFPGLVPMWVLFSFASWGDLSAGLLVVVLLGEVVRIYRGYLAGRAPTLVDGARMGAVAITTLYLRSSTSPLLAGAFVLVGLGLLVLLRGRQRLRALGSVAVAGLVFVAVLAPWSLAASHVLGSRVVTTTTVATSLGNTFGDREKLCYGPCDPDSTMWFSPLRYARETAAATGVGEVEVLQEMSAYARQDVTAISYAHDVRKDFRRYLLEPSGYEDWFRADRDPHAAPGFDVASIPIHAASILLYFPALLCGLALMFVAVRRNPETQLRVLGLKLFLAALMLQPFVHLCTSRYWPTFGPLFALAAVVLHDLWSARRVERAAEAEDADPATAPAAGGGSPGGVALADPVTAPADAPPTTLETWFFRIQVLLSVGTAAVVVGVLVLSLFWTPGGL